MRRPVLLFTSALLLSAGVFLNAADDLVLIRLRDYLEALRIQVGVPGLAAIVIGPGEVQGEWGFGDADQQRAVSARPFTPFHVDGLTQLLTAATLLGCAEQGRLSLDAQIGQYKPDSVNPTATVRQILSHTTATDNGPVFAYRPERLDDLGPAVGACNGGSLRDGFAEQLERLGMYASVPGPDAASYSPSEPIPAQTVERYNGVLATLATPYAVDAQLRATASSHPARTLTASRGLVSTARDFAQFDLALKRGVLMRAESLAAAWTPPVGADGQRLPHGLGW